MVQGLALYLISSSSSPLLIPSVFYMQPVVHRPECFRIC